MKLSESEITQRLSHLPDWTFKNGKLTRFFNCPTYASGVALAVEIAMLSEKINHHPDSLEIMYKKLRVAYITHDVGGITALDFEAAEKVSDLI
jgi:4a-hydroxytetrahydrobiopterin dehydratase